MLAVFSGDPSNPKCRMLQMCFKYKCATTAGYTTTAPPDEEVCPINETLCTQIKFLATGAGVSETQFLSLFL